MAYLLAYDDEPLSLKNDKDNPAVKTFHKVMAQFSPKINEAKLQYPIILQLCGDHVNPASKTDHEIKETHMTANFVPTEITVGEAGELSGKWTIYESMRKSKNGNEFLPKTHLMDFATSKQVIINEQDKVLLFYLIFVFPKCEVLTDSFGNNVLQYQREVGQMPTYKIINSYQSIVDNSIIEEVITEAKSLLYGKTKMKAELLNAVCINYGIPILNQDEKTKVASLANKLFADYEAKRPNAIEKVQQFIGIASDYDFLRMKSAIKESIEKELIRVAKKDGVGGWNACYYVENGDNRSVLCNIPINIIDPTAQEDYICRFLLERNKDTEDFFSFIVRNGVKLSKLEVLDTSEEDEVIPKKSGRPLKS